MLKKRVSAREAAADIRAGMDDSALMKKYNLSSEGLQSLFDKLIHAGFIDLGEVENRLRGMLGTVAIPQSTINRTGDGGENGSEKLKQQSSPLVNAQEAARDIRMGMNDHGLMEKYKLSFKGLQSLFEKLMSAGLITQPDLARRISFDQDHTVDLREEKLSFRDALQQLGLDQHGSTRTDLKTLLRQPTSRPARDPAAAETTDPNKNVKADLPPSDQETRANSGKPRRLWYNNHAILGLLLISPLCPLGLYGLYRNATLSHWSKAVILLAWVGLVAALTLLVVQTI